MILDSKEHPVYTERPSAPTGNPVRPKIVAGVPSLPSRPLDLVYFVFFAAHIPASLLIDFQAFYPTTKLIPKFVTQFPELYVSISRDPLIGGAMGYFGNNDHLVWFKSFLVLEAVFQLPVFFLGLRGLCKGSKSIYVLLLIYAASTTTTTLPCLSLILNTPLTTPETIAKGVISVTSFQRWLLLSSYIPFFLIPLLMTIDMSLRVWRLVRIGILAEKQLKRQ